MTTITLTVDGAEPVATTLDQFIADNEFSDDEAAAIREAVAASGSYTGGGGAAPVWTVAPR